MNITQRPVSGMTYGAEWSPNLVDWNSLTTAGNGAQHVFAASIAGNPRLFMRLKVTRP